MNICLKNGGVPETCLTKPDEDKCQEYINWYENDAWENNEFYGVLSHVQEDATKITFAFSSRTSDSFIDETTCILTS